MNGFLAAVRRHVDDRCFMNGNLRKAGCRMLLNDTPKSKIVIDLDKPFASIGRHETRCDYLFISESDEKHVENFVIPMELKNGDLDAKTVLRQLQAGALLAQRLVPENSKVVFYPIAVVKRVPQVEREYLKKTGEVKFHEESVSISVVKCGTKLMDALKNPEKLSKK